MPPKVRDLVAKTITISGALGDDARPYQVRDVETAVKGSKA